MPTTDGKPLADELYDVSENSAAETETMKETKKKPAPESIKPIMTRRKRTRKTTTKPSDNAATANKPTSTKPTKSTKPSESKTRNTDANKHADVDNKPGANASKTILLNPPAPPKQTVQSAGKTQDKHEGAAVMSALIANVIVAAAKFIVGGIGGVSAMVSEGVHSVVDSVNEITLIIGKKASTEQASRKHPLGGARKRYFAAFLVVIFLFGLGGLFTIMEAMKKISEVTSGAPGSHDISSTALVLSIVVSLIAICAESWSLHNSYKESRELWNHTGGKGEFSLIRYFFDTKSSDLTSVIAEDTLAIIGLIIAILGCVASLATGDEIYDSMASLLIGVVLVIGAVVLGRENASLLIGEGAADRTYDAVYRVIEADPDVEKIIRDPILVHLSERRIDGKLKLQFKHDRKKPVETQINELEEKVRAALPWYDIDLTIEPDVYDPNYHRD